jgi:hypothetical protein
MRPATKQEAETYFRKKKAHQEHMKWSYKQDLKILFSILLISCFTLLLVLVITNFVFR